MRYRKIDPRIWKDEKFISHDSFLKLVVIYCLTTPQSNRIGIFNFSAGQAAEDLETLPEAFREGFKKVCETFNWRYDKKYRVLYIPKWWKYNKPENPNVLKACLQDLHEIPNSPLKEEFKSNLDYLPETFHETFAEGLGKRSPKQEQEQEQEQDKERDEVSHCPHQQIISLYHEILPELPKIKDWSPARQQALRTRWCEDKKRQDVKWWKGFFEHVSRSEFLMGNNGRKWQPNLEWLIKKENFINVIEGKYHNG